MLKIKDMNLNNVIRQGDSQPREYQLDTGNLDLNLTNKSATIRLMTADFQGIGYETTATVSSENKISFSIDDVIPARQYRLEVTVDDYVFPSRATDGQFNIDPSSHGQEVNIIQIIGKDEIVRDVKARVENELEPFLGDIEQAELARQDAEAIRQNNEVERQRMIIKLKNLIRDGDFSEPLANHWRWPADQTATTLNNEIIFTPTGQYKGINQLVSSTATHANHLVYVAWEIKSEDPQVEVTINDGATYFHKTNTGKNEFERVSFIYRMPAGSTHLMTEVRTHSTGNFKQIQARKPIVLDLTDTYGENVPTLAEVDQLVQEIGWFENETTIVEGVVDLISNLDSELKQQIETKANKQPEPWITPTLLNGTTEKPPAGATENRVGYRLYDDGVVRLRGTVTATALFVFLFTLPPGYRPTQEIKKVISSNNNFGLVRIFMSGSVILAKGDLNEIVLDDIEFDVR